MELQRDREARAARIVDLENQVAELVRRAPPVFVANGLTPIPDAPLRPRGVYVADFLTRRGHYVLYAVDRAGRYLCRAVVHDPARWSEYVESVWATLEDLDPIPVKLVP